MYNGHLSGCGLFDNHFPLIAYCVSFTKYGLMVA
jgi:hypothetical protein